MSALVPAHDRSEVFLGSHEFSLVGDFQCNSSEGADKVCNSCVGHSFWSFDMINFWSFVQIVSLMTMTIGLLIAEAVGALHVVHRAFAAAWEIGSYT